MEKFHKYFSAHFIFDGNGKSYSYGIIETDYPRIRSVSANLKPIELPGMIFLNGVLFPELESDFSRISGKTASSNNHHIVENQTEILKIIYPILPLNLELWKKWTRILQALHLEIPGIRLQEWIDTYSLYTIEVGKLMNGPVWHLSSYDFDKKQIPLQGEIIPFYLT